MEALEMPMTTSSPRILRGKPAAYLSRAITSVFETGLSVKRPVVRFVGLLAFKRDALLFLIDRLRFMSRKIEMK